MTTCKPQEVNININGNKIQQDYVQKLPINRSPGPYGFRRRKWQHPNQQLVFNDDNHKKGYQILSSNGHISSANFLENVKLKTNKVQKPISGYQYISQFRKMNKNPLYLQKFPVYYPRQSTSKPKITSNLFLKNRNHIEKPQINYYPVSNQAQLLPTNVKVIKQIGEKGPIRTIPAPNLSSDHGHGHGHGQIQSNELSEIVIFENNMGKSESPSHQYQVHEDEILPPAPSLPIREEFEKKPIIVVPEFNDRDVSIVQVPIQFEKSFYNLGNYEDKTRETQQAYASISFVEQPARLQRLNTDIDTAILASGQNYSGKHQNQIIDSMIDYNYHLNNDNDNDNDNNNNNTVNFENHYDETIESNNDEVNQNQNQNSKE